MNLHSVGSPGKKFLKIGEVCRQFKLEPHVLRSWEQAFPELSPRKNRAGHRIYSSNDVAVVARIKYLLHGQGLTVEGARRQFRKSEGTIVAMPRNTNQTTHASALIQEITAVRELLLQARNLLDSK